MGNIINTITDLTTTDSPTHTTLLTLPPELRLRTYEGIFNAQASWLLFNICDRVYLLQSHRSESRLLSSLARTNRLLHGEIMSYSYGQVDVDITVHDTSPRLWVTGRCIGTTREVLVWPYLRKLNLHLRFTPRGDGHILVQRLSELVVALEKGKHLNSLAVRLIWGDHKPIPQVIEEVIEELQSFELKGSLKVIIDGNLDEEESDEMERDINRGMVEPSRAES